MEDVPKTDSSEAPAQQEQAGFTRRDFFHMLGFAGIAAGFVNFLSSLPDDRNFQEAELEVVKLSSRTEVGSMNPLSRVDITYHMNPDRRLQFGNVEKYIVSVRLPDGTIDSREVSEDIFKQIKKGDKIHCKYLIRYDGMQLVTEVLSRAK